MFFSPRARNRDLAALCRRLAISLESGIEVRKIFARETKSHLPSAMRRHLQQVSNAVAGGHGIAESFDATGSYFPSLFRELIRVGEQTGHLDEVFRHLADHYEHQELIRREFLSSISWPLMQLGISIMIVGLVIWISGLIGGKDLQGNEFDILGFGLKGTSGVLTYFHIIAWIVIGFVIVAQAVRRGFFWARPIQRFALYVPTLGPALQTLAVARFAWSLHLTSETGMSLLKAMPLCIQAMQNITYTEQLNAIMTAIRRGDTMTEALTATGVFPPRFLDAVDIGERSGRLPETMKLLTDQYQDEARRAIKVLMQLASWAVSLLVMGFIVFFIFRMASFYLNMINAAMKM